MYQYDEYDQTLVEERVAQFRDQTDRFLHGELSDEQFRPLRLMNGVYLQRHAPMLRVAIPYGLLSSRQLRVLAHIARTYDKGSGHFTTRQNLQFNWPPVDQVPEILAALASVEMHAIQTSGNCIRNVTSDHLAGIATDEIEDPRPYCEIIRQWSTLHPEFSFLPRKFKISVTGAAEDRAAGAVHDLGLRLVRNIAGEIGFEVRVGGGLGRTPVLASCIMPFLEKRHLLSYLEAILRVYNRYGRRDNIYKARIKILVKVLGADVFAQQVAEEWEQIRDTLWLDEAEIDRVRQFFLLPAYDVQAGQGVSAVADVLQHDVAFARWYRHNSVEHRVVGYRAVYVSLKPPGGAPGDMSEHQMEQVADLADRFSDGTVRVMHTQNLLLANVRIGDLYPLWQALAGLGLATPTVGTANDVICCPGLDYCSLANARSLPIAAEIQARFADLDYLYDLGDVRINISGCMNGCGHHSVGHIGVLGVDKKGEEWYQITLGGCSANDAALGERLGPAVSRTQVTNVVERILTTYHKLRWDDEGFLATVRRIGLEPFQERIYDENDN